MRFRSCIVFLFFANALDVFRITPFADDFPCRLVVIAFVQTEMLRRILRWLWSLYHDGIECRRKQQMVVHIGSRDADR